MDKKAKEIIDSYLQSYIDSNKLSGNSCAIARGEEVIYEENFGYANIEKHYKTTSHTCYRLASNTKVITAVAVLICHQNGWLNIYDTVDKYIPGFENFYVRNFKDRVIDSEPFKLQIKQLLNHSSGFGSGFLEMKEFPTLKDEQKDTLEHFVENVRNFSLSFRPDAHRFTYSAVTSFNVLARLVEIVSHLSYYEFLKKYIFNPLGMKHTTYSYEKIKEEDHAITYKSENGELIPIDDENKGFDSFVKNHQGGGAGLISTLDDYLKFGIMLTQRGVYKGTRILKEEMIDLLTDGELLTNPEGGKENWGLGVWVRNGMYSCLPIGSFGWSGAYGTHYVSIPKYNLTLVYMHNSVSIGGAGCETANGIEEKVVEALHLEK